MEPRAWDAALSNGQTIADLHNALARRYEIPLRGANFQGEVSRLMLGSRRVVGRRLRSVQHSPHRLDAAGICTSTNTRASPEQLSQFRATLLAEEMPKAWRLARSKVKTTAPQSARGRGRGRGRGANIPYEIWKALPQEVQDKIKAVRDGQRKEE